MVLNGSSLVIQEHVPLAPYTTFGVGGPARYFASVASGVELQEALLYARERQIPFFILGGGSNILVSDQGFPGMVIRMRMSAVTATGETLEAEAGAPLFDVVSIAAEKGLEGIHFLAGIPGTVGGASRGNAGAFGAMTGDTVKQVSVLDVQTMEVRPIPGKDCRFGYRSSLFKEEKGRYVITSVFFGLGKGDVSEVKSATADIIARRGDVRQHEKSAGSFFVNPIPTDQLLIRKFEEDRKVICRNCMIPAGWLVDQAGLRGARVGGAMVSQLHGNYLINTGTASAADIVALAGLVKERVRERLGIDLQEEVEFLGFDKTTKLM